MYSGGGIVLNCFFSLFFSPVVVNEIKTAPPWSGDGGREGGNGDV